MKNISWEYTNGKSGEFGLYENIFDKEPVAMVDSRVVKIGDLCTDIEDFINEYESCTSEIKNDGDKLGIIVDIWEGDECIETATFWFEDYMED